MNKLGKTSGIAIPTKYGNSPNKQLFALRNIMKNINNLKLKNAGLSNDIKPIEDNINDVITTFEESKKVMINGKINNTDIANSKENVKLGELSLENEGIYVVNLQLSLEVIKNGIINYIQCMVENNGNVVNFNSLILNVDTEKGHNHTTNLTFILEVTSPITYDVVCNIGYMKGQYKVNNNSKINAVEL